MRWVVEKDGAIVAYFRYRTEAERYAAATNAQVRAI